MAELVGLMRTKLNQEVCGLAVEMSKYKNFDPTKTDSTKSWACFSGTIAILVCATGLLFCKTEYKQ